jgi:hypothetical protein
MEFDRPDLSLFDKNSDSLDYCPFVLGLSKSELGLRKISEDNVSSETSIKDKHFLVHPDSYDLYLNSKRLMREIHPEEDYHTLLTDEERLQVFKYMSDRLSLEYPEIFKKSDDGSFQITNDLEKGSVKFNEGKEDFSETNFEYRDALDFIALNIQEDFCLVNSNDLRAVLVHLASPNDWTAKWGIGKDFDEIHVRTPRAFEIVKRPPKIFGRLFSSGFLYERFGAMTLTSFPYLLRHPSHKETPISSNNSHFFFRFERQTLKAIPGTDLLLFTIRPYLMDFTKRVQKEINLGLVEQMSCGELENRYTWFFKANRNYFLNLFKK